MNLFEYLTACNIPHDFTIFFLMVIILLVLLIHIQHDFFEEKNCVGEEPWEVTTLITGHYHP